MSPDQRQPNRLINESSPYLIQHAYNPVDWFPWSDAAFAEAKVQNKLILLSIGYSTCHWCHVMAHESFENEAIAAYLNRHFIAVKVDREEMPDVDAYYMRLLVSSRGSGGWPLTVFMTPDKDPFLLCTYLPPQRRHQMKGFDEILRELVAYRHNDPAALEDSGKSVTEFALKPETVNASEVFPDCSFIPKVIDRMTALYDFTFGGFKARQKFPCAINFVLMSEFLAAGNVDAAAKNNLYTMLTLGLNKIRQGGVYDHIGLGIHRYAIDARWQVPHFEKMLYDQATAITAYAAAAEVTGESMYAGTVAEIDRYIHDCLRCVETGLYFSSEDADSEGEEGKFYVFHNREIQQVLGDRRLFDQFYHFSDAGNYTEEATGEKNGTNIFFTDSADFDPADPAYNTMREKLLAHRNRRIRPHLDNKIIFEWNAWLGAAYAFAGCRLNRDDYIAKAVGIDKALQRYFIHPEQPRCILCRVRCNGRNGGNVVLADYAAYNLLLIELFEAIGDVEYLISANRLAGEIVSCFYDEPNGNFFLNHAESRVLPGRMKETYDGALPSGNSMMLYAVSYLVRLFPESPFASMIDRSFPQLTADAAHYPPGYGMWLRALQMVIDPTPVLLVVTANPAVTYSSVKAAFKTLPAPTVLIKHTENASRLSRLIPFVADFPVGAETHYRLCRGRNCGLPVTDLNLIVSECSRDSANTVQS